MMLVVEISTTTVDDDEGRERERARNNSERKKKREKNCVLHLALTLVFFSFMLLSALIVPSAFVCVVCVCVQQAHSEHALCIAESRLCVCALYIMASSSSLSSRLLFKIISGF